MTVVFGRMIRSFKFLMYFQRFVNMWEMCVCVCVHCTCVNVCLCVFVYVCL